MSFQLNTLDILNYDQIIYVRNIQGLNHQVAKQEGLENIGDLDQTADM